MPGQRLEELIDGRLRPVCEARPLLLSAESPWAGFLLERDLCRAGRAQTITYPHTSLVLAVSGAIDVEDHALARGHRFRAASGSVTLWPAGYESRDISWTPIGAGGPAVEMIRVHLQLSTLQRLAPDDDRLVRRPLDPHGGLDDSHLAAMLRLMAAEIAAHCPSGRLFAQSLCLALAAHVAQRYARSPVRTNVRGGLSQRQLQSVRERIESQLDGDLSLVELAAVAGVGPHHFVEAFRKSVGSTPHQYVLHRRIAMARTLLTTQRMPVAEVAAALGFSSQSHFTQVFRRIAGTTPSRYRREH